jgi:hypothetical protein
LWKEYLEEEAIHTLADRKQRKGIQGGSRARYIPQSQALSDIFPPAGPHFLPFTHTHPIMPSYYELIKELIH